MPKRISRRSALMMAALPAVARVEAAPDPGSPDELLARRRRVQETSSQALRKCKIEPGIEPAFSFRA